MVATGVLLGGTVFACAGEPATSAPPIASLRLLPATTTTVLRPSTTMPPSTTIPAPATTASTLPRKGSVIIHGTGDVNLDPAYIPALASRGYDWAWSGLQGLFAEDDLTVVNLECSPSGLGSPEAKAFTFRCADEGLAAMAGAGVEVANLANNHSQDFGKEAMLDGRANLEAKGIFPVGTGATAAQAGEPAIFELNGWKVAVVGFGGVRPHDGWIATADQPGMADGDSVESMVATVEAAHELADWVVVTIHWGVELDVEPRAEDVDRARAIVAAGADVIFGHHTHRLQPFELLSGRPVAWGLGNFVWPNLSPAGSRTAVARVVITPQGQIAGCLLPAVIESPGHPVLLGPAECDHEP